MTENDAPDTGTEDAPAAEETVSEGTANDDATPAGEDAPPWGDDFDPARAWKTIQTLREAEKELKALKRAKEDEENSRREAEMTEIERLTERAEKAEAALAQRDRESLVAKVAKAHGIPDDLVEFLTGDTEETLTAQAERLGSKVKSAPADDLPGKPKPRLTPGTGSDDSGGIDPAEVARRIRASS